MLNTRLAQGLVLFLSFSSVQAQLQMQKVQSFDEMKTHASQSGKLIFIDAYTDWCGWCKVMDEKTFAQPQVGDLMKEKFVNYKLEMEKDSLGIILSMKYGVTGFPTFLIFNSQGVLHAKIFGYIEVESWMKMVDSIAQMPTPARPAISANLIPDWPDFYKTAFGYGTKRKMPKEEQVLQFLKDADLHQEMPFRVASRFSYLLDANFNERILSMQQSLSEKFGADEVNILCKAILDRSIMKAVETEDVEAVYESIYEYEKYFPDSDIRLNVMLYFYQKTADFLALAKLAQENLNELKSSQLNEIAWEMYLKCDDEIPLKKALSWMEQVVKSNPEYDYVDTYASLLFKTENYTGAEKWALEAIEVGKTSDRDVTETEKLLEKIKQTLKK